MPDFPPPDAAARWVTDVQQPTTILVPPVNPDAPALARAAQQTVQESTAMFNALPPESQQAVAGPPGPDQHALVRDQYFASQGVTRGMMLTLSGPQYAAMSALPYDKRPQFVKEAARRTFCPRRRPGSLPTPTNSGTRPNGSANSKRANHALAELMNYLDGCVQYARGEKLLQEQLKHPANQQQTAWLTWMLYRLYIGAIARDGYVSLGSGVRALSRRREEAASRSRHADFRCSFGECTF